MSAASALLSNCNWPTRQAREIYALFEIQLARVKRASASVGLDLRHTSALAINSRFGAKHLRAGFLIPSRAMAPRVAGCSATSLVQLPDASASGVFSGG